MKHMKIRMFTAVLLLAAATAQAAPSCRTVPNKDEYGETKTCRYRNTTLEQAYRQYRQQQMATLKGEYRELILLPEMPKKALRLPSNRALDNGLVETEYTPLKNGLLVEWGFEGGVDTLTFRKRGRDVETRHMSSPD